MVIIHALISFTVKILLFFLARLSKLYSLKIKIKKNQTFQFLNNKDVKLQVQKTQESGRWRPIDTE